MRLKEAGSIIYPIQLSWIIESNWLEQKMIRKEIGRQALSKQLTYKV